MQEQNRNTMPAEWEKHQRTFLEWPVRDSLIRPENYAEVCKGYAQVARSVSAFEPVAVIVNSDTEEEARRLCGPAVELLNIPHDDAWARDNGPTFVRNPTGALRGISWRFNAWGEKYSPFDRDDAAAGRILEHYGISCVEVPMVLEGGSIHTDGEGTLLTTEQCLLNPNRNPGLTRAQIEDRLMRNLNVSKILWLKNGLFGDETDGHVDNVACFARPGVILMQVCRDPNDPNYEVTQKNREVLERETDAQGRKLTVIEILQPPARYYHGDRLTLSYLNFYFVNGGIILPVFGGDAEETDRAVSDTLKELFPGREIVTVDGMPLIKEGGNVHCITQQMPEAGCTQEGKA